MLDLISFPGDLSTKLLLKRIDNRHVESSIFAIGQKGMQDISRGVIAARDQHSHKKHLKSINQNINTLRQIVRTVMNNMNASWLKLLFLRTSGAGFGSPH